MSQFHRSPVHHVGYVQLKVKNLPLMTEYYVQKLGFQLISTQPHEVSLGVDGRVLLRLVTNDHLIAKAPRRTGLYHFAILLPTRRDLASFTVYANQQRLIEGASDHGVSEALYFTDPEGNGIEVYRDREPHEWPMMKGQLQMVTEAIHADELFALNPPTFTQLPKGTLIGHIHLHVHSIASVEQFYHQGLGLDLMQHFGAQAGFLGDKGYHHHVGINTWNGVNIPRPTETMHGLDYFTWVVHHEDARQAIVQRLESHRYPVEWKDGDAWTNDPAGNRIRIVIN